jgi:glycine/D-amino acid oxidase-like deaminating enzyme
MITQIPTGRRSGTHAGWDAVVVGARVAGASTALLLARAGLRVLVVDRARRGSDTVSEPRPCAAASCSCGAGVCWTAWR